MRHTREQVAREADIPASTVRLWFNKYKDRIPHTKSGRSVLIDDEGIEVFKYIKQLSEQSLCTEQIEIELDAKYPVIVMAEAETEEPKDCAVAAPSNTFMDHLKVCESLMSSLLKTNERQKAVLEIKEKEITKLITANNTKDRTIADLTKELNKRKVFRRLFSKTP